MIVPFGKRANLILSDGTKVWMNSGSRLIYSPVFKGSSREVFLDGEAYFEVTKDEKKPFFVRTNEFKVKVYRTKFDVQAYKEDNDFSTILMEGKVSLTLNRGGIIAKEHFLYPDQKAILTSNKDNFLVTEVANINNYTAWKEGYLIFKNETFQSIIKRVSHYYNIQVELKEEMLVKRLSGKLDLKDDPERVMDGLALISKIKYVKDINKYRFYE
jgi:ferric-dicitrate binding protein FerR (iron transport regulator)